MNGAIGPAAGSERPVGFVGVGTMGRALVNRLLAAGHQVICFDVSVAAMERCVADGAAATGSPSEVARAAGIIFSMLPASTHVADALTGPGGAIEGAGDGNVFVELSTIERSAIDHLAARLLPVGASLLDGGVSASPSVAWAGGATLLIGGPEETYARVEPVLASLGSRLIHTGPLGTAKVAKLVNNLVGAGSMALLAEAFVLGAQGGIDPETLHEAMMASWARCANLETMPPVASLRPARVDDERFPDFSIDYMIKDLSCVLATARDHRAPALLTALVHELFAAASAGGFGGDGIWNVIEPIRALAGEPGTRPVT